ncbi:MAG TPA: glycosyltransferase family 87 protein, partial [Micromonosporaceae bacterium]
MIWKPTGWRIRLPVDRLAVDLLLYGLSAAFAAITAVSSTLAPHRAWGAIAAAGYVVAALAAAAQLVGRRFNPDARWTGPPGRWVVLAFTAATTVVVPLAQQAMQRAAGRSDRAQEEVVVVEHAAARLLDVGMPYLSRDEIAALPAGEQLLGYVPYQPGMVLFGLPRALAGAGWWTDARVWFALVTAVALALAVRMLRPAPGEVVLRAVQVAAVFPVCALTLATGGDDLPVLALCLLALTLCAKGRYGRAGLAVGSAAALKLFAAPVLAVLLVHAVTRGRRAAGRLAAGAIVLPTAALVPALLIDAAALVENVVRFPAGEGLVASPARSPLPGYLIASALPAGRQIATAVLGAAALTIAVGLVRRPPRTAAMAALAGGYGLLGAILLMPSTRFGYLLYPVAILAWSPALRSATAPTGVPTVPST